MSKNGLTITYHLRRDVRWQDGAPFTAADVVFSWRQVMNPRNDTGGSRQGYDRISRIDVPNPTTLVVHLKQKYAPFVATFFAMSDTAYCILPKHVLGRLPDMNNAAYSRLPIGTGPFKVIANDGTRVTLAANPDYWRGAPKLKEIDFRYIPRDREIIDLMKAHKIDFYENAAQALEPELHGIDGATVYLYPFTRWTDVGFNLSRPQLKDRRVREALAYAIDRSRLIERVTHGVNFPADSDQPPFFWAHNAHVPTYPFNAGMARRLLDRAGWRAGKNGLRSRNGVAMKVTMVGSADSQTVDDTEVLIRHDWRAVGVDVVDPQLSVVDNFSVRPPEGGDRAERQIRRRDRGLGQWRRSGRIAAVPLPVRTAGRLEHLPLLQPGARRGGERRPLRLSPRWPQSRLRSRAADPRDRTADHRALVLAATGRREREPAELPARACGESVWNCVAVGALGATRRYDFPQ